MSDRRYQDAVDRARKQGLLPPAEMAKIRPGAVFAAVDRFIQFPSVTPERRTEHATRRVIVVQAPAFNPAPYPVVLVVPCSASGTTGIGSYSLPSEELEREGTAFTKERVVAYPGMVQPCLKANLGTHLGDLMSTTIGELRGRLAALFGFSSGPSSAPHGSLVMPPR